MHTASEFPGGADTASDFPGISASVAVCRDDGVEDADLELMDDFGLIDDPGLMDAKYDAETNVMEVWSEEDWLRQFQPGPPQDRDEKVGTTQGGRNTGSIKVQPSS